MAVILEVLHLLLYDVILLVILLAILVPLGLRNKAATAVAKRNFFGYFSNPTGYAFLCLFVLLTSFAAIWPHDFFNENLANLDQLNKFLPLIMLLFIPAITMSIWSEERRERTDELLLTLPANDFDIVMGKFVAAGAVFSVSLVFSQLCNVMVLASLAKNPETGAVGLDTGLLAANYFGHWLIGLSMLSLGMIASFLTSNMTIGFIFGMAFNVPMVAAAYADIIVPTSTFAQTVSSWSIASQFDDFRRGVFSLSSISYFMMVIVIGLYVSMVLIGRRHWTGGRDGRSLLGHYLVRTVALITTVLCLNVVFRTHDVIRYDATDGQVSSLSSSTLDLIRDIKSEHPIKIEAFISLDLPQSYVRTRYDLISMLKEFSQLNKIELVLHDNLELFAPEVTEAEERYGITPQFVRVRERGELRNKEIIMGAAFRCGLKKVVIPIFDYGISVEYELMRSIATVADGKAKKIGVVRTDAQVNGGGIIMGPGGRPQSAPQQELITELAKQYDIEDVELNSRVEPGEYDMLLAVQPSSLGPEQLSLLIAAIRDGQPTAIFEDPFPSFVRAPATGSPRQAAGGGMFGQGGPPPPKGDIRQLWDLLELEVPADPQGLNVQPKLVWQTYNPYPKLQLQGIPDTWVFVPGERLNQKHAITNGLNQLFFPIPGMIMPREGAKLNFEPLASTTDYSGWISFTDYTQNQGNLAALQEKQGRERGSQVVAAHITGSLEEEDEEDSGEDQEGEQTKQKKSQINVIYVADIDLMHGPFFTLRARPDDFVDIKWRFENPTFLLNIVDELTREDRYITIRNRRTQYSTLQTVEAKTEAAHHRAYIKGVEYEKNREKKSAEYEQKIEAEIAKFQQEITELQNPENKEIPDPAVLRAKIISLGTKQIINERKKEAEKKKLEREYKRNVTKIKREVEQEIRQMRKGYKLFAVLLPPIPPLLIGLLVFISRRLREREGAEKSRLR
jgi:ABC-2 type transport system permease protein